MRDISFRKREPKKYVLAEHDTLTDRANRNKLHEQLAVTLAEAKTTQCEVALLMMDLDKFKQSTTLGHACGDQLLCSVCAAQSTGRGDESGRPLEVVAHLPSFSAALMQWTARKCFPSRRSIAFSKIPFSLGSRQIRVHVSIGVAISSKDCGTAEELLGNADLTLYPRRLAGRARYVFFERDIRDKIKSRLSLEAEFVRGLQKNEFELFYQPQVHLGDSRLLGAEALIRWRHPVVELSCRLNLCRSSMRLRFQTASRSGS